MKRSTAAPRSRSPRLALCFAILYLILCCVSVGGDDAYSYSYSGGNEEGGDDAQPPSDPPPSLDDVNDVVVSGMCDSLAAFNGVYSPVSFTVSGRPWYKNDQGLVLYWDPSCDGVSEYNEWVFSANWPSVIAESNLDHQACDASYAYVTSTSETPPLGTLDWTAWCDVGETTLSITVNEGGDQPPVGPPSLDDVSDVFVSDMCATSVVFNGVYRPVGFTASGRPWFQNLLGANLYWDPSCDGYDVYNEWVFSSLEPSLTASFDLDGEFKLSEEDPFSQALAGFSNPRFDTLYLLGQSCQSIYGYVASVSFEMPPFDSTEWMIYCDDDYTNLSIKVSEGGDDSGGDDEEPPLALEDVNHIAVSGMCELSGDFEGDYVPIALTASGRPWYRNPSGMALFWDQSCIGAIKEYTAWVFSTTEPSITAACNLDGEFVNG